jgi:hypothetical protein
MNVPLPPTGQKSLAAFRVPIHWFISYLFESGTASDQDGTPAWFPCRFVMMLV